MRFSVVAPAILHMLVVGVIAICLPAAHLRAVDPPTKSSSESLKPSVETKTDATKNEAAISTEAVMTFVREHQPDLAKLLEYIKQKRPEDFESAVSEIVRVKARLESVRKRDEELYKLELALWKNDAQLRLLAAELSSVKGKLSDKDRERIKSLLEEGHTLTVHKLEHERVAAQTRLDQLDEQLKKRQANHENIINKGLKQWEGRIDRGDKKPKANKNTDSGK
ncbi:MAG: hypothetical protein U0892_02655 [Pirellulales bacterium]